MLHNKESHLWEVNAPSVSLDLPKSHPIKPISALEKRTPI
jgi:hypothetical protein